MNSPSSFICSNYAETKSNPYYTRVYDDFSSHKPMKIMPYKQFKACPVKKSMAFDHNRIITINDYLMTKTD
jgi:hypothetical protein